MLATVKSPIPGAVLGLLAAFALSSLPSAAMPGDPPVRPAHKTSLEAFASFGSAMGQGGHFGELGWTDEQFGSFVVGMVAAYQGKPYPEDEVMHRLSAEMSRRASEIDSGAKGAPVDAARPDFPLSAYAAFGSSVGEGGHFSDLGWSEEQFNAYVEGMRSAFKNKPYPVDDSARELSAEVGRRIAEIESGAKGGPQAAQEPFDPAKLVPYLKEASKRYHLQLSDTGLGYNVSAGTNGIRPRPGDTVVISCEATAADGTTKLPQLSSARIRVRLGDMMPGFREGLQMMTVGSHAFFVFPPALSFGRGEWPEGVQAGSPIIFEVTLADVVAAPAGPGP
jgi:FKBP-type peptidyl-prolyl cis-trans isomerase